MIIQWWKEHLSDFSTLENLGQLFLWLMLAIMLIPLSLLIPFELLFSLPLPWSKKGGD